MKRYWIKHKIVYPFFSILLSLFVLSLIAEIGLSFLPVRDYTYPEPVNNDNPVLKLAPNRDMTFSKGWNFLYTNNISVNNDGFVNSQYYDSRSVEPLISVVGDSYVEALIVPYEKTIHGILAREVSNKSRVYSFGLSGAPLSQYLVWAKYSKEQYGNQLLIINVVGSDFDESLLKYKNEPGSYYYRADDDMNLVLTRIDYNYTNYRFLFRSNLVKYLIGNLGIIEVINRLTLLSEGREELYVGNVPAEVSSEVRSDSRKAIAAFFRDLPSYSGLPKDRVLLIIDAARPSIYEDEDDRRAENSYYAQMRKEFIEQALGQGYAVIDMEPIFIADYRSNGKRFEFPRDGHWNALGHQLAADAVIKSRILNAFLEGLDSQTGSRGDREAPEGDDRNY